MILENISPAERRAILITIILASAELGDAATEILSRQAGGIELLKQIETDLPPPAEADPALTNSWRMMRTATQLVKTIDVLAPLFGMSVAEAFEPVMD
jgi:hypothetical protein